MVILVVHKDKAVFETAFILARKYNLRKNKGEGKYIVWVRQKGNQSPKVPQTASYMNYDYNPKDYTSTTFILYIYIHCVLSQELILRTPACRLFKQRFQIQLYIKS